LDIGLSQEATQDIRAAAADADGAQNDPLAGGHSAVPAQYRGGHNLRGRQQRSSLERGAEEMATVDRLLEASSSHLAE